MAQNQNASQTSLYEEDFPSLSDVGEKNNSSDKNSQLHTDSFSYSARVKTSFQENILKNVKVKNRCAQVSNKTDASHSTYRTQMENYRSITGSDSLPKNQESSYKSIKNDSFNKDVPQSFISSDQENAFKKADLEQGWTVVRKKVQLDQSAQKCDGPGKSKTELKNISSRQSSSVNTNISKQRFDMQDKRPFVASAWMHGPNSLEVVSTNQNKPLQSGSKRSIVGRPKNSQHRFEAKKLCGETSRDFKFKLPTSKSKGSEITELPSTLKHRTVLCQTDCRDDSSFQENDTSALKAYNHQSQSAKVLHNKGGEKYSKSESRKQVSERDASYKSQYNASAKKYTQNNCGHNPELYQSKSNNQIVRKTNSTTNEVQATRNPELKNNANASNQKRITTFVTNQSHHQILVPKIQHNVSSKENEDKRQCNKTQVLDLNSIGFSKKKRKSKVKRQAAMQSDKIRIITSEVHAKILNLNKKESVKPRKNIVLNINDSQEYPELGSVITLKHKCDNVLSNGGTSSNNETLDSPQKPSLKAEKIKSPTIASSTEKSISPKAGNKITELGKNEEDFFEQEKQPVHHSGPITISLFDMLLVNKAKKKEPEKCINIIAGNSAFTKVNVKKQTPLSGNRQTVNPLDSSKPAIKRGKEREKPKPKRPSQLKRIILLDRKQRKEQILQQLGKDNQLNVERNDLTDTFLLDSESSKSVDENTEQILVELNTPPDDRTPVQERPEIKNQMERSLNLKKENDNMFIQNVCLHSLSNVIGSYEQTSKDFHPSHTNINSTEVFNFEGHDYFGEKSVINYSKSVIPVCVENSITSKIENVSSNVESEQSLEKSEDNLWLINNECMIKERKSFSDINENEGKYHTKYLLSNKLETSVYESGLSDIRYLFEKANASKNLFLDELALAEVLRDVQYLFKSKSGSEIFSDEEYSVIASDNSPILGEKNNASISKTDISEISNYVLNDILENTESGHDKMKDTVSHELGNIETKQMTEIKNSLESKAFVDVSACATKISLDVDVNYHQRRYSDQEILEACLIVLHSKKFREYCTHFLSQSLEETVFALLDDLARFQDRMHQKDPVKARMKRRLLYGIREIKRHMKLKKLKCIIIASDIEDSKTEGGLNDIVNDLKSLAKNYQVPCIFSHLRRKLGQVCHKPGPVSAVGVFNYEGSEVNFKKMLELQNECKMDYIEVFKSLSSKLTDEQIDLLYKKRREDLPNLHSLITRLIRECFPKPEAVEVRSLDSSDETKCLQSTKDVQIYLLDSNLNTTLTKTEETSSTTEEKQKLTPTTGTETSQIYNILVKYKIVNY